jgi:hypothetical protein
MATTGDNAPGGLYTDCGCGGGATDDAEPYDAALADLEPDWLDALAAAL